jgi:hypothetical protein
MSERDLSPTTRALLRAARAETPSVAVREKVWATVASTVGGTAGACAAGVARTASTPPGVLVSGTASASKMLALGTLLGGAVTVGLAAMLLRIGAVPDMAAPSSTVVAASAGTGRVVAGPPDPISPTAVALDAAPVAPPLPPLFATATVPALVDPHPPPLRLAATPPVALANPPYRPATSHPAADSLAREASLVAQAHAALVGGDPHAALRAVRAARMLSSHVLGPEELSVEAQALRVLGRDDQARRIDSALKREFPESALAPR